MIRRIALGLLAVGFVLASLPAADQPLTEQDEPPPRLKKKDKPAAAKDDPAKPDDRPRPKPGDKIKEDDPGEMPEQPMIDEQEVLNQIIKNSRKAEDRLANKEVDDTTKQLQRDVLKGIEDLIKASQQPPPEGQQGQQGEGGQQAQGGQGQQGQQGQQGGSRRTQRGRGSQTARGQGQGQGNQQEQPSNASGTQGSGGGTSTDDAAKLAEIYKDIWGHLPESLRAEMNAYSREQFMDKYRDQLKRYYSKIAEKGRKGD